MRCQSPYFVIIAVKDFNKILVKFNNILQTEKRRCLLEASAIILQAMPTIIY